MSRNASSLYRRSVPLDPAQHGLHRVSPLTDFSITRNLHAVFITATEFPQAGLDFPLLFVATGQRGAGGRAQMSTVALLGLVEGENLQLEGERWTGRYIPAAIRRYPFASASSPGPSGLKILVDDSWPGFSDSIGEPLFAADGRPAAALRRAIEFVDRFELEAERTRIFCERVVALDVLKEMKAEATLPDGETISVDGFHAIDEERLRALPDATVLELYRSGMLALLQMHLLSLANIRHLVTRLGVVRARRAAMPATP
jgi:hypothetical protein